MTAHRPQPQLYQAIQAAHLLNQPEFDNPEYLRGQAELIIDTFAVDEGMDVKDDIIALIKLGVE